MDANYAAGAGTLRGGRAGGLPLPTAPSPATSEGMTGVGGVDIDASTVGGARASGGSGTGRRGGVAGSSEARLLLSLVTMDCRAAVAGGEERSTPGGCRGGSDASCTAFVDTERGGNGGGMGRAGAVALTGAVTGSAGVAVVVTAGVDMDVDVELDADAVAAS